MGASSKEERRCLSAEFEAVVTLVVEDDSFVKGSGSIFGSSGTIECFSLGGADNGGVGIV